MARGMPSGMQVWTGSSPEPPLATSARLASNLAWYSGVRGACWPRAGGLVESKTPSGPTLCHWPAIGGYLFSSNGCWAATGPAITTTASATEPITLRKNMFSPPMRGLLQGPPASRPLALGAHLSAPPLAGEEQSHRSLPLRLPACGERLESARSSREFRVKASRPEFELCREDPHPAPSSPQAESGTSAAAKGNALPHLPTRQSYCFGAGGRRPSLNLTCAGW